MTKRDDSTMKKMSERLGNYEIPLTALKDGEAGIIMSISGGGYGRRWGFEKRLADLGLTPGTRINRSFSEGIKISLGQRNI